MPSTGSKCPSCGKVGYLLNAEAGSLKVVGFPPSIIVEGTDPVTQDTFVRVDDPHVLSEARLTPEGSVTLGVKGAKGVGRPAQQNVTAVLYDKLKATGLAPSFKEGVDSRGEDALLLIDGTELVVQIVTTPSVPAFWREASVSSASTQVGLQRAADWVHGTADQKAQSMSSDQRRRTVLAIDARHASIVARPEVTNTYLSKYPDPQVEYGFASIWIVGPTVRQTVRLGSGLP